MSRPIPALSIRQPWAWLIVRPDIVDADERRRAAEAGILKLVENRDWTTPYRGRLWIHAGKTCTARDYAAAVEFVCGLDLGITVPPIDQLPRGGIVGAATLTDCVVDIDSPWFIGEIGYLLSDPWPCDFSPCKGQLGFFIPKFTVEA